FRCTIQATAASRTTPTLLVLVIRIGVSRIPLSSIQCVPVISPLPLPEKKPANTPSLPLLPRGRIAVTPVRTGPLPTTSFPSPEINVLYPTSTPTTSVIALSGPGVPSNGIPISRARGSTVRCPTTLCASGTFGPHTSDASTSPAHPRNICIALSLIHVVMEGIFLIRLTRHSVESRSDVQAV